MDSPSAKALQLRMAKHLLECAWALYQLRNYNGMGAIVSGLSSISVSRLKYLWEGFTKSESKVRERKREDARFVLTHAYL